MMQTLAKYGVYSQKLESVLDLGTGTGFLGISIASRNPHVNRLDVSDWLWLPLVYSATNWQRNKSNRDVSFATHLGILDNWVGEGKKRAFYDVVVCNPPYLPLVDNFPVLAQEHTVAGTKLLEWVIVNSRALGRRVFVHFSDVARPKAHRASSDAGVKLTQLGEERRIPFRVRHALKIPEYMQVLQKRERGLEYRPHARHKYWHTVRTYIVEASNGRGR